MSIPILATKLYIPPPRSKIVARAALVKKLNDGLSAGRRLTLISAPAGFGKTTLISEWAASAGQPLAWLALDEGDGDPARFLIYLVSALKTIAPHLGEGLMGELQALQSPPTEALLTVLVNEIAAISKNFILVLDDYHLIDSRAVDNALTFLLDHQPRQMHLVITTREDPNLPLARLRVRGQMTELRAVDLRFSPGEAAEFLNEMMGLSLSAQDIAALETRTEGWIAGLQLAALSMQGNKDVPGFIQEFTGDHRYIVDYLVEEVLKRQPESVRNFLLQTAILERLNSPLCEAVTGQPGGKARLETLQRGNFFLIPLDDKRHWYRYHHLFADVLQLQLQAEQPGQVAGLHRRASGWYEQNGLPADAIRHALAGADFERVADLVERTYQTLGRNRQEGLLLGWFKQLPEALIRSHPVLCNLYAGILMQTGEIEGVETWLLAAERWLDGSETASGTMLVADQEEFRRLPGAVAVHRAGQALLLGNVTGTLAYAQRALDLAPEQDFLRRGGAAALLGLAFWTSGDLEAAQRMYTEGMALLQRAGNISDVIGCAIALADIYIAQGRLRQAARTCERALQLAAEHGTPSMRGSADMLVGLGELYREQNDLPAALQYLQRSKEQGEHSGLPQNRYRWRVALAHIRVDQGDLVGALDLLQEAERMYVGDFSPNVRPVQAATVRVWVLQDRFDEALGWARERGLTARDEPGYLREFEYITLARILLAQATGDRAAGSISDAIGLLERLLKAAQDGGRTGSLIEILVLQALAHQSLGNLPAALTVLQQALSLAEPEGYVRLFVGEGLPMRQLLLSAAAHGILPGYTARLLSILAPQAQGSAVTAPISASPAPQNLIEPLSQRELELLRLFKTELSGPEIADQLMIALSTVRTHTKSIFGKLNVNNRRAAVKRAAELNLI